MSMSRRRDISPQPRPGKLRMDRQPVVTRITDPSLPAGKRKEIDNVMKKARSGGPTNEYWDKKLLEVEEKDPNRWRHTGYKKMYIEGESSSESEREGNFRYNRGNVSNTGANAFRGGNGGGPGAGNIVRRTMSRSRSHSRSRSRSRLRKTPPSPSPMGMRRRSPPEHMRRISPGPQESRRPRSPLERSPVRRPPRSPDYGPPRGVARVPPRPRSPPEPPMSGNSNMRRNISPRSPMDARRRSPSSPPVGVRRRSPISGPSGIAPSGKRGPGGQILPRSKRPPSPPPKGRTCRSRSNSSSSCSDDSCLVCSLKHHPHSRSPSIPSRSRPGPRSPPPKSLSGSHHGRAGPSNSRVALGVASNKRPISNASLSSSRMRPVSPPMRAEKYRPETKVVRASRETSREMVIERPHPEVKSRANRHSPAPVDPRLKHRPPEPPSPAPVPKKKKEKTEKIRTRIKIEGEKKTKKHHSSSDSDDSESDSESSLPTFTATTRLTLSERFGKMAQWSMDRSNMENMRITKDSAGGALKVMIEEGLESPRNFSPAPVGHFPEELATTAPSGMLSWDDVRVRFEYYKSRGYLRDLDLKDYIKWEEWWYRYQEWLKQERYYEFWERQQMHRRRRKKIPITQRLN